MLIVFDKHCASNKNSFIEIINSEFPIKISIYDLIKKLESEKRDVSDHHHCAKNNKNLLNLDFEIVDEMTNVNST